MQHRQEDRTLNGKLELALLQQFTEQFGQARLAPKSLEDQHRPDLLRRRHLRCTSPASVILVLERFSHFSLVNPFR